MRRTILIVIAAAIVSAGIATGVTILLGDDDEVVITSPLPSASAPSEATDAGDEDPSPSAKGDVTLIDESSASPSSTGDSGSEPSERPIRSAESVNCDDEPNFCSKVDAAAMKDDKYVPILVEDERPPSYSGVPTISMDSVVRESDKSAAEPGDRIESIHVEVVVTNKTSKTFVFAKREIVLEILRDGKVFDTLTTTGKGFEMTPSGKMTGTFDRPITMDGTYSWQARTWYHPK